MKKTSDSREAFLALVRAGLWGDVMVNGYRLKFNDLPLVIDYEEVLLLAEEQSVVGLVVAGFEKLKAYNLLLTEKLTLLGKCQLIEQRNEAMNRFIAELVGRLQDKDVNYVLVKGQGVAQCYERPNWRCAGDIDFLLDKENYQKAKAVLIPLATEVEHEDKGRLHQGLKFGPWTVELHGTMHTGVPQR